MIKRARAVLADLEATESGGARRCDAAVLLRAAAPEPPPDPVREALDKIDPDALSPREAHAALYELKRLAKGPQ